ncbi:glycoside hydrolase family 3 protein [Defluviitalea saccharophila]|uniref:beta-N-acetylhexosaminidase n=1 Tax=Defluviitalea saccharophila TaxID=879970 RepID=A0ABZ2Y738_9FIRM|nr:glycoside hydrolase family 3 [Candidatus Epulonipiscium sp.]
MKRSEKTTIWKRILLIVLIIIALLAIVMVILKLNFFNEIAGNHQNTDNISDSSNQDTTNNNAGPNKNGSKENETDKESNDNSTDLDKEKEREDALVNEILNQMDLHQKVCQMFIVFADSLTGVTNTTVAGDITKNALKEYPVGGVLFQKGNLNSEEQVSSMIQDMQSYSNISLFIASDEEGGRVARVMETLHPYSLDAMLTYKDMGKDKAYENASLIADSIGKYGFNTAFAPVADVWSNPENTVIGDRAYSDDFEQASELVSAAVQGFRDKGMICSLKHFPGHGDTKVDSHYDAAYVTKSLDQLRKEEFLPFKAGIDAGADMVMIGHLIVPDIDEVPATFSHKIVTDILKNELNFKGIVITDALNMQAITNYYDSSSGAIHAVKAGVDILLCPSSLEDSVEALEDAVRKGDILEERIDESVRKILKLKLQKEIISDNDLSDFQ